MNASQRWHRLYWVAPPWGDYGDILLSGMTARKPRTREGLLRLERTGPFVPPITLAGLGDLLVTEAFRASLEESSLSGLAFRPVEKTRIVRLRWEHWDWTADEPREYPDGGEPESYILGRPHDRELAMEIGPIWEVLLPSLGVPDPSSGVPDPGSGLPDPGPGVPDPGFGEETAADLVRDRRHVSHIYASERARNWLEQHAGDWLSFAELSETV
jgi:hypothetical protein